MTTNRYYDANGQHHVPDIVGNLWRIKDPNTVQMGNCFLKGRLKTGDLFLCVGHAGDCCQHYIFVEESSNCLTSYPKWSFAAYGIGDAERVPLEGVDFKVLEIGGRVHINKRNSMDMYYVYDVIRQFVRTECLK